ncbi:protein-L-isoaspartate(D-aspartate) O-methyltransferase [Candidatus Riflebacteria bacterium]
MEKIINTKNILTFLGLVVIPLALFSFFYWTTTAQADSNAEKMVRDQIKSRGVKDPAVLTAMCKVKRHLFVPTPLVPFAYGDRPLSIGYDQTISQPFIVAYMTELLKLKEGDRVLEIGTGSGYQAAILAEICHRGYVYTIEIVKPLADRSKELLKSLGYKNIEVKAGDGFVGWKEHAPFDAIIVTCAPESIPPPLLEQLAEGGRLVIPLGAQWQAQVLQLVTKEKGKLIYKDVEWVRFVPMTGKALEKKK